MSIYIKTKIYKQLYVIIMIVSREKKKGKGHIYTLYLCPCTIEFCLLYSFFQRLRQPYCVIITTLRDIPYPWVALVLQFGFIDF